MKIDHCYLSVNEEVKASLGIENNIICDRNRHRGGCFNIENGVSEGILDVGNDIETPNNRS